jgi:hypothetical protein
MKLYEALKGYRELTIIVILGTMLILSIAFLLVCLRSMIPVDGIFNRNGVRVGGDFIVFYSSALMSMKGDAVSAYNISALSAFQLESLGIHSDKLPWHYPPVYLFFLFPFAYLGFIGAFWAWSIVTIMGLMVLVRQITSSSHYMLLVPLCFPVAYSMAAGQNGNLTAMLIGTGLILINRSACAAGIVFGLLVYKPQLAAVIPFCLIAAGLYRTLFYMIASASVLIISSFLVLGTEPWIAFITGLAGHSNLVYGESNQIWERIPTVAITSLQLIKYGNLAMIIQFGVAVMAIATSVWVWKSSSLLGPRALAIVSSIPLISPFVMDYDMATLIVPIAFIANEARGGNWTAGKFVILLMMWIAQPSLRMISGDVGVQIGPILWVILLIYSVSLVRHEKNQRALRS